MIAFEIDNEITYFDGNRDECLKYFKKDILKAFLSNKTFIFYRVLSIKREGFYGYNLDIIPWK